VAFADAVYSGEMTVEGVTAALTTPDRVAACLAAGKLPVVVDPACSIRYQLQPWGLVDAILAKRNCGTTLRDAAIVIGVGPGFTAGQDVHKVVETMRGHDLGRVITKGCAQANTGIPGDIGGYTLERLVKAPRAGRFRAVRLIGDVVRAGEVLAYVDDEPVTGEIDGVLRGLLHDGLTVTAGMKIGDIDPRAKVEHCWTISDKARAIGGGVLEALLMTEPCSQAPNV
jgi:xanthine dehydrogenase accessory factor